MKTLGIILAGGRSTRLYPATRVISKQLLPIFDKPMIYYALSTLMLAGIKEYLVISTSVDAPLFKALFEDSVKELGISVQVAVQHKANGIAESFKIAAQAGLTGFDKYALILGDNVYYGASFTGDLQEAMTFTDSAVVFTHKVKDPERFGVAEFDTAGELIGIEEKPINPKSNSIVTGLYFYPNDVIERVKLLSPSKRGELEITDLNNLYLRDGSLVAIQMKRGMCWFDSGTPAALMEAGNFVRTIQENQNVMVGSPHEIAFSSGWITKGQMFVNGQQHKNTPYGDYMMKLARGE